MAESNGAVKANGHVNGKMNGSAASSKRRSANKGGSYTAWTISTFLRLATWAAIINVLFRCPSSLDACDDSSPYFCKQYYQVKQAAIPHVQPYYDQYAAPYVDVAQPYYRIADDKVFSPARGYATQYGLPWAEKAQTLALEQWNTHAQPQLAQVQTLVEARYKDSVAPYLDQAGEAIGPYYGIAKTNVLQLYYEFALPAYQFAQPYALQGFETTRDFTWMTAVPAASWAWDKTYVFLDGTVWPQIRVVYLENVEPQLVRIGERLGRYKSSIQTKPGQEKLSASAVFESASSSFAKPPPQTTASSTPSQAAGQDTAETTESHQEHHHPVEAPPAAENDSEKRQKARQMVQDDLQMWQDKFASQADEGAADMEERVAEIAKRMIEGQANVTGKQLVDAFEIQAQTELHELRAKISSIIENMGNESGKAEEEIVGAIRAIGVDIKEKAQQIREWREKYDFRLQNSITGAADVHFQILDETRTLALQQIGMKWAWADGVTYKDWAKYHELKKTLSQWTDQLKELIVSHPGLLEAQEASAKVEDEAMEIASSAARELGRLKEVGHYKIKAKDATDNFETEAMKLAADAAYEAEEAASVVAEEAQSATLAASENLEEATSSAASAVGHQDEDASWGSNMEDVTSTIIAFAGEATETAKEAADDVIDGGSSIVSEASSAASDAASDAASEISESFTETSSAVSDEAESISTEASSVAKEAKESASSLADEALSASSAESLSISESIKDAMSEASEDFDDYTTTITETTGTSSIFLSAATEAILGETQTIVDNDTHPNMYDESGEAEEEQVSESEHQAPSEEPTVKRVPFGAAAQEVPERQIILDDYVDPDRIASATSAAAEAYSSAIAKAAEQYSSAASVVSAQIYGTPKPVHEQLFASVSGSYENAIAAASSRMNDAVQAASTGVFGTPTTTPKPTMVDWEKVEAIATSRLNEGRLWAEMQYSSALIAMGLATPTPTSPAEKYYDQAKLNYYAGLGLAQERFHSFRSAASSAFSSMTATPTPTNFAGTASSMASVAKESAASVVQAAENAAGSAYSDATDTVASVVGAADEAIGNLVEAASDQVYIAGSALAESWDTVLAEISDRIYAEPSQIGWAESVSSDASSYAAAATEAVDDSASSVASQAAKQYNAVRDLVSELLVGREPTYSESVLAKLSAAYSTAAANVESVVSDAGAKASSVGDKVGSAMSEATEAVKETVQRGKDEL